MPLRPLSYAGKLSDPNAFVEGSNKNYVIYKVISEQAKTCQVGLGESQGLRAIDQSYTGAITIPATVYGYQVKAVGDYAFYQTHVKTINLPEGLTKIGSYAFHQSYELTSLVVPEGVTSVGYRAFYGTEIPSIILPEGMTQIDEWAFYGCSELAVAMLPSSLASIDKEAFTNCSKLVFVSIPGNTTIGTGAFRGQAEALHPPIQSLMMCNPNPATYADQVGKAADATLYVPPGKQGDVSECRLDWIKEHH